MVEINRNAFRDAGLEFVLGTGRFVAPAGSPLKQMMAVCESSKVSMLSSTRARRRRFPTCPG
jgi:hypothetical protein